MRNRPRLFVTYSSEMSLLPTWTQKIAAFVFLGILSKETMAALPAAGLGGGAAAQEPEPANPSAPAGTAEEPAPTAGPLEAAKLYRWTDAEGRVHYSDRVPPEAVDKAHDQLVVGDADLSREGFDLSH